MTLPIYQDFFSGYSIVNYVKVHKDISVYDGDKKYWAGRVARNLETKTRKILAKKQKNKCVLCKEWLRSN